MPPHPSRLPSLARCAHPVICLRVAALPQRWPACRAYDTDVIENPTDLRALGDKGDLAHLTTALLAQQRERLLDSGDQHRPQLMRIRPFGWLGLTELD